MTDKPNYNDGNWHVWDGQECPVHDESMVEMVWPSGMYPGKANVDTRVAKHFSWYAAEDSVPCLFRVIKEHREPRECWSYGSHIRGTEAEAVAFRKAVSDSNPGKGYENHPITKWREVLP